MSRLTRFITPVGMCMTNLDSMKHYMPCVLCRNKAEMKIDANGKCYTEKHSYCDNCEVKMLFNKLKHYEDLEEQGRLIELPCAVGTPIWYLLSEKNNETCEYEYFYGKCGFELFMFKKLGKKYFLTEEEVLEKLKELRGEQE